MSTQATGLDALQDIRKMMEKSSRFISLSGWSGIAAGSCALAGSAFALHRLRQYYDEEYGTPQQCVECLKTDLLVVAVIVFSAAFISAFFFTFLRSKKDGVGLWGPAARRLLWNTFFPMMVGGIVILRMLELKQYENIAGISLIFYGLALVNGSRFTLGEIRYLGYAEVLTGLICLWVAGADIYFWAFGFGVLHIIYGFAMWWKYERNNNELQ